MELGMLVCGNTTENCLANTTLDHLSVSIDRFATKAAGYLTEPVSEDAQIFGAFCARVMLENSFAALIGRLDPFRMLYLAEFQNQGGFDYTKPTKSGFKWTGDVVADEKSSSRLWDSENDTLKVSRALFSPHADHLYWRPAVSAALDYLTANPVNEIPELTDLDPDTFNAQTRGKCAQLYSKLSKGVHWEFFVSSVVMDEGTLKDSIRDCFLHVSSMAFISHFIPTSFRSLDPATATSAYSTFRKAFP